MLDAFKNDIWLQSREQTGYFGLATKDAYSLRRHLRGDKRHCCGYENDNQTQISDLFENGLRTHPLLDIAFEAFARAEARLGNRFIPQRSHEERLTGHLISELEAAIQLAGSAFQSAAQLRYQAPMALDFAYYDLSRGGKIEKQTGSDLGLILLIDLPDRPKLVRYAAIQAKKMNPNASIDKLQFDALSNQFSKCAYYMFYDCNLDCVAPPMMMPAHELDAQKKADPSTKSFTVNTESIYNKTMPLSLWLVKMMADGKVGEATKNLEDAVKAFRIFHEKSNANPESNFQPTRLAMISIGKKFTVRRDLDGIAFAMA